MERKTTRREFLKQSLSAGAGLLFLRSWGKGHSPNDKLNIAVIGVGGRGWDNLREVARENIVALCDVDLNHLANAAKVFPNARLWTDYRRMLDRQKDIDAVVISTPDHTHALPMMRALQMGKHVYCEKPLVHTPWEARQVREAARQAKVATQMGNQAHSSEPLRIAVEVLRSGVIGTVREVHAWSDRPIGRRASSDPPIPSPRRRTCSGTCGWDLHLSDPTTTAITHSHGAGGGTSARAHWATWAAILSTPRTGRWTWGCR
jgi:predicted dehydrogenase